MTIPLAIALTLAATPVRLAAPAWQTVDVDANKSRFFSDYFAQQIQLARPEIRVTTESEIGQLIGLERQKTLLGCNEGSSNCMAELAGALGVDGVITGNLARTGRGYLITLKIVRANDAQPLALASGKAEDDDHLADWLSEQSRKLGDEVLHALHPETATQTGTPAQEVTKPASGHFPRWIPIAVGGAALVSGGVLWGITAAERSSIHDGKPSYENPPALDAAISGAQTREKIAYGLAGAGAVVLGAGLMWQLTGSSDTAVSISASPSGAGLAVSGVLP